MPEYVLPELARSLRSLGAHRDAAADAAHASIFVPLLEARARAGAGSLDKLLAALKGEVLSARIEGLAIAAATQGVTDPARVRALTARAGELLEPLEASLLLLDARAAHVRSDDAAWESWVAQLRAVFLCADSACAALARLIAQRTASRPSGSWFIRGGG
jgi:hypothetical protein